MLISRQRGGSGFAVMLASAVLLSAAYAAAAKTVYVDGVNGNNAWDGLCEEWDGGTCGPKKTIQAGIDTAVDGDEVIVADAVYDGTGNRNLTFFGKAITLRSASGPDNCIIDCSGSTDPAFRFQDAEGPNSVLDGFIVTKCSAC